MGKAQGFEPKKEPETVKTNCRYWKQFLTYYYWVIHSGSHFTMSGNSQQTPADSVQLTDKQDSAWAGVIRSAWSQEQEQL